MLAVGIDSCLRPRAIIAPSRLTIRKDVNPPSLWTLSFPSPSLYNRAICGEIHLACFHLPGALRRIPDFLARMGRPRFKRTDRACLTSLVLGSCEPFLVWISSYGAQPSRRETDVRAGTAH